MPLTENSDMLHHLQYDGKNVILVGTAHVSRESEQQVKDIIEQEKPDTVCVELCPSRYQSIRQKERWQQTDIVKVIKEKKSFLLLSNLLLASFQKRIAKKFDINPGAEMIKAIETAEEVGAEIHLADRDIRTTLSRTWRAMGLWSKIKLMFQLILSMGEVEDIKEEDIEKMKQEDVLESLLAEVGRSLPILKDILIDERDQYLAEKIKNAPGNKIVAVVGAGHVQGIQNYWDTDIDIRALEQLPPQEKDHRHSKMADTGCHHRHVYSRLFLRGSKGRQGYARLVGSRQWDFGRPGGHHRFSPSSHHCFFDAGGTIDFLEPDDRGRLGLGACGSLFPQTQSKRFGDTP